MIQQSTRKVWHSSIKGRDYLSKRSAIRAEAVALIVRRYPTQPVEYENGFTTYEGFHWTSLPRHEVLLRRVMRMVKTAERQSNNKEDHGKE